MRAAEPIAVNLEELDRCGFTVVRRLMDRASTSALRAHMDELLPRPTANAAADGGTTTHQLRHPIPGRIMADVLADDGCLHLAQALLRCPLERLRLNEQVLIRTDSAPPGKTGPSAWHVDWAFLREQYEATPRETYFHMVTMLSTVEPGGGAFTIVPGSHQQTYDAAALLWQGGKEALDFYAGKLTQEAGPLATLKADPIGVAGIDVSTAHEVLATEGDCIVFNPMCLHSGSFNQRTASRYVYFQSYHCDTARYFRRGHAEYTANYDWIQLRANLPSALHTLLLPPSPDDGGDDCAVPTDGGSSGGAAGGVKSSRQEMEQMQPAQASAVDASDAAVASTSNQANQSPPPPLSRAEVAHFKEWGFIIKRGYLSSTLCAAARDWVWTHSRAAKTAVSACSGTVMAREDPESWAGPFKDPPCNAKKQQKDSTEEEVKEVKEVKKTVKDEEVEVAVEGWEDEYLRNDRWIVHQFGREKLFLDLLPRRMMPIAEQLLDGAIVQPVDDAPMNSRNWAWERGGGLHGCGMYATVPMREGDGPQEQHRKHWTETGLHVDGLACNLGCVGYIEDVPPDGGGLAIYPGSHRRMHHTFENAYAVTPTPAHAELRTQLQQQQKPFVFEGHAGDVILYHHRMFHSATQNFGSKIRMALFYDFVTESLANTFPAAYPGDLDQRPAGQRSALGDGPPPEDMWRDWSSELRYVLPEPPPLPKIATAATAPGSATAKL